MTNIHPLPVSWYFISSLWWYLCSCTHTMSMSWSIVDVVSSSCWPILFKVLILNVAICFVLLYLSNFHFYLSFVADHLNTGARAPTSAERTPFLPMWRAMQFEHVIWVRVMVIFQWLYFNLINRCHPKTELFDPGCWLVGSSTQHLGKWAVDLLLGLSTLLNIHHAASHGSQGITCEKKELLLFLVLPTCTCIKF